MEDRRFCSIVMLPLKSGEDEEAETIAMSEEELRLPRWRPLADF